MPRPIKVTGWGQGIFEDSIRRKEDVGTFRRTEDNRGYRYVLAGATELAVGKLTSSPAEASAHLLDEAVVTAAAIGDSFIYFTSAAAVTLTVDELIGGYYVVNDGTGEGQMRRIVGNQSHSTTLFSIALEEPLRVATVATTTQHTILLNPWSKIIKHATIDFFTTGVPQAAITGTRYGWAQTAGWGVGWLETNTAAGSTMKPAATDGQLVIQGTTAAYVTSTVSVNGPCVGVAAEYYPQYFIIDK